MIDEKKVEDKDEKKSPGVFAVQGDIISLQRTAEGGLMVNVLVLPLAYPPRTIESDEGYKSKCHEVDLLNLWRSRILRPDRVELVQEVF